MIISWDITTVQILRGWQRNSVWWGLKRPKWESKCALDKLLTWPDDSNLKANVKQTHVDRSDLFTSMYGEVEP